MEDSNDKLETKAVVPWLFNVNDWVWIIEEETFTQ